MNRFYNKLVLLVLVIVTALTFTGCSLFMPDDNSSNNNNYPDSVVLSSTVEFETVEDEIREDNIVKSINNVYRSVVSIRLSSANSVVSGSGVLVDIRTKDDAGNIIESDNEFYILTCHHVIADGGNVQVSVPDENGRNPYDPNYNNSYVFTGLIDSAIHSDEEVTLVGGDKNTDVAVLKLDISKRVGVSPSNIVTAKVAHSTYQTCLGEPVFAIGNPGGELPGSVSRGIISYIDRRISISEIGELDVFQHDATIDHGSSGGGLFNSYGELIGITNAGSETLNNIYYAIPYTNLKAQNDNGFITISKQLIASKTATNYGYISGRWQLGITTTERVNQFDSPYVSITSVLPNSNAQKSGLREGDIITSISYIDGADSKIESISTNSTMSAVMNIVKKNYTIGNKFIMGIRRVEGKTISSLNVEVNISEQYIFCDTGK